MTRRHRYRVERVYGQRDCEIMLVRYRRQDRRLQPDGWERADVVASRRFDPRRIDEVSAWEALLATAAGYAERGELGCFVVTTPERNGTVRVELVERRVGERAIEAEILASRRFDAQEDDALVASAEFAAELRVHAEHRNEESRRLREDELAEGTRRSREAEERERAARELAQILARAGV